MTSEQYADFLVGAEVLASRHEPCSIGRVEAMTGTCDRQGTFAGLSAEGSR